MLNGSAVCVSTRTIGRMPVPYDEDYIAKHYRHVDGDGRRYKHENPTAQASDRVQPASLGVASIQPLKLATGASLRA